MRIQIPRSLLPTLATIGVASLFAADQPAGFSRKILAEQDLATPGKHGVVALVEFQPGGFAPRHQHPGEEMLYVIEGSVRLEVDGQAARELGAGEAAIIPPGTPHSGRNTGAKPARIVSSYFVEKGQPLASPVK